MRCGKEAVWTDLEVRAHLQQPSIDCLISRARIRYAGRVARNSLRAVLALLHSKGDGEPLAWTALFLGDLRALLSRGVKGTSGLADPLNAADDWNALMHVKGAWNQIATDLMYLESSCDRNSHTDPTSVVRLFNCDECQCGFPTSRALQSHRRARHGRTSLVNNFPRTVVCPACGTDFVQRIRCLKHVSDPRRPKCKTWIVANCTAMSPVASKARDRVDRAERTQAYRCGHSQPLARLPAHRRDGRTVGRVST